VELDLAVAVRLVVLPEHLEHALHLDAGRVERHQHHRVLVVAVLVASGVRAMKMATLQRGSPMPLDHHLRPFSTT
jgi:hypothetical protein